MDLEKNNKIIGCLLVNDFTDENGNVLYGNKDENDNISNTSNSKE